MQSHVTLAILMRPQQPFCDLVCPLVILFDRTGPQLNSFDLADLLDLLWRDLSQPPVTLADLMWP